MQFTLGISGDLLTNEGNPCFGVQPLEALYKEKKILGEWMEPSIQILSEKEPAKYDAIRLNSSLIIITFSVGRDTIWIKPFGVLKIFYGSI